MTELRPPPPRTPELAERNRRTMIAAVSIITAIIVALLVLGMFLPK